MIAGWVLLPAVAALQRWAPPAWVESGYARPIYPRIALLLSSVNQWAPFSLAEASLWILLPLGGALAVRGTIRAFRAGVFPARGALRAAGRVAGALGWILLVFSLFWGLHYRRPPLAERLGIATGGTPADLLATARWLARETARMAPPGTGPTQLPYSRELLMTRIEDAYRRAAPPLASGRIAGVSPASGRLAGVSPAGGDPIPSGACLGPAKLIRASGALCYLGLSGIFIPFTGEPNVNGLLPDNDLVFAAAHEKAHQRGIAPENEANFTAFLALYGSEDPYLRYCAAHDAASHVLGALARVNPEASREVARLLDGRPMADWKRSREFWGRYRGPAERVSRRVNDLYLRANRVPGGVQSYGAVTDLLVGYYRDRIR